MRARGGLGPENLKTKHGGSVSGVPWQTAMQGNGGRCWGDVDNVVLMVELHIHKCEPGEGAGAKKSENQVWWLSFGCVVANGVTRQWGEVLGWCG
jgi:hypothetical protein